MLKNKTPPALPWIIELEKVKGLNEISDKAKLSAWLKSDGKTLGDPAKLPWCGDAVDTAISLALPGEPRPADLGKNVYWALNWLYFGKAVRPCYGCVGVFKRPEGGHVGFLVGESEKHYLVFGGNQKNSVRYSWLEKDRLRGARWPSTFPNPNIQLPKSQVSEDGLSINEA